MEQYKLPVISSWKCIRTTKVSFNLKTREIGRKSVSCFIFLIELGFFVLPNHRIGFLSVVPVSCEAWVPNSRSSPAPLFLHPNSSRWSSLVSLHPMIHLFPLPRSHATLSYHNLGTPKFPNQATPSILNQTIPQFRSQVTPRFLSLPTLRSLSLAKPRYKSQVPQPLFQDQARRPSRTDVVHSHVLEEPCPWRAMSLCCWPLDADYLLPFCFYVFIA